MRRFAVFVHAAIATVILLLFSYLWFSMLFFGEGAVFSPGRVTLFWFLHLPQSILVIYSLQALPTACFSACRCVQLASAGTLNLFASWRSLRALANTFAGLVLTLLVWVIIIQDPAYILRTLPKLGQSFTEVEHPLITDDNITYPEPPLSPLDLYDWTIYGIDGRNVPMEQFRNRPLFLYLWAPGNRASRYPLASLQRLYQRLGNESLVNFVILALGDPASAADWLKRYPYDMPLYTIEPPSVEYDTEERAFETFLQRFPFTGLPSTYILCRDGRIVFQHNEPASWDSEKTVRFLELLTWTQDDSHSAEEPVIAASPDWRKEDHGSAVP